MISCLVILPLCILAFLAVSPVFAVNGEIQVNSFNGVSICAPYSVVIRPSWKSGMPYRFSYDADSSVVDSLNLVRSGSIIRIETSKGFRTNNLIKLYVEVPRDELQSVSVYGSANVVIGSFVAQRLTIENYGNGVVYAPNTRTNSVLTLNNLGSGTIAYGGPVNKVVLTASQTSSTYITSVGGAITYTGSGISKTYIQPAKSSVRVTGSASSLAQVKVGGSSCNSVCQVTGRSSIRSPCSCTGSVSIPTSVLNKLTFTCGVIVDGASSCSTQISASASSSNGVSYARSFSSSGSGTSAIAIASTTCSVGAASLKMV